MALMGSVYAACNPVSCWKRYQTLLFALMVWSILRTMRFSLSELFIDWVRLFAQPEPLDRFAGVWRRQQRPFASSGQERTGVGVPAVLL